jgi:histone H3/H4
MDIPKKPFEVLVRGMADEFANRKVRFTAEAMQMIQVHFCLFLKY